MNRGDTQEAVSSDPFVLKNGTALSTLSELAQALPGIDPLEFAHHVTEHKNDFSTWIFHSFNNKGLADALAHVKSHQETCDILSEYVQRQQQALSQSQPVAASTSPSQRTSVTSPSTSSSASTTNTNKPTPSIEEVMRLANQGLVVAKSGNISAALQLYQQVQSVYGALPEDLRNQAFVHAKALLDAINAAKQPKQPTTIVRKTGFTLLQLEVDEILRTLSIVEKEEPFTAREERPQSINETIPRIKTYVPGFDSMISKGIPKGASILVSGGPGSGKTTFCIQMLGKAAERGEKCLFMTFEESEEHLIEHMESYGLNARKYIEQGNLVIQQQDPFKISRIVEALLAFEKGELMIDINSILNIVPEGFTPDRVVIDSLSAIASAFSDTETTYRIYVNQLVDLLKKTGATSFLIGEVQGIENIGHGLVEEFLADGVVIFYNLKKGSIKQSALEILKMRAVNHDKKIVPFEFVPDQGIVVYPSEKIFL